ncbi:MAG: hypothetical protein SFW67_23155 [Myxococcaceae bacterium]|nr:hypothetical protein [Myxococcaceae bacterium]
MVRSLVRRLGRLGGLLVLGASLLLLGAGAVLLLAVDFDSKEAGAVSVVPFFLVTLGVGGSALGARSVIAGDTVTLSDEALLAALGRRPVTLCLDCRAIVPRPPCPHCGFSARCVTVRSDDDVSSVTRELGLRR